MKFLSNVFAALSRLAASLNATADLIDAANEDLRARLSRADAAPQLTGPDDAQGPTVRNGNTRKAAKA
jgi:hypothetical protein